MWFKYKRAKVWQSSSAEIGQLRSCTAHVVGRILVMCQYSRCTVTCTTQLSCPASLVAIHWYNPVLIWVRFFSKTCPGLEMSETGKTTPGLTKKRLSDYTGGWNTELIEPPDQISSRAMTPQESSLSTFCKTLQLRLPCAGWSMPQHPAAAVRSTDTPLLSLLARDPQLKGMTVHVGGYLALSTRRAPRGNDLTYWLSMWAADVQLSRPLRLCAAIGRRWGQCQRMSGTAGTGLFLLTAPLLASIWAWKASL